MEIQAREITMMGPVDAYYNSYPSIRSPLGEEQLDKGGEEAQTEGSRS